MLHRHLNHSKWTLAAIDDVIARGRLDDWKELRDAATNRTEVREWILRVSQPDLSDPYAQRYHFRNFMSESNLSEWEQLRIGIASKIGIALGHSQYRKR